MPTSGTAVFICCGMVSFGRSARGELSEAEAQHHPRKNLLLRAVGIEERLHVDGDSFPLETGDRLLLATDGLTNMVDDDALAALLGGAFAGLAERMVERALAGGGSDNITAIAVAYETP